MPEVTTVVIAYNEADLLQYTLPPIKAVSDQVIIVDMGSNDGSRDIYGHILDADDLILDYPRENLSRFGFSHPRNFGGRRAKTEWILVVDCDEYIDVQEFRTAKEVLKNTSANVFDICRINYQNVPDLEIDSMSEIIARAPSTSESHRRLYRNAPRIRWEGMIHEEIWIGDINAYYDCMVFPAKLHHMNQYKRNGSEHLKFGLYSYLTLQAIEYPGLRYGTNDFWFTTFAEKNFGAMIGAAADYAKANNLTALVEDNIRRQLLAEGISV